MTRMIAEPKNICFSQLQFHDLKVAEKVSSYLKSQRTFQPLIWSELQKFNRCLQHGARLFKDPVSVPREQSLMEHIAQSYTENHHDAPVAFYLMKEGGKNRREFDRAALFVVGSVFPFEVVYDLAPFVHPNSWKTLDEDMRHHAKKTTMPSCSKQGLLSIVMTAKEVADQNDRAIHFVIPETDVYVVNEKGRVIYTFFRKDQRTQLPRHAFVRFHNMSDIRAETKTGWGVDYHDGVCGVKAHADLIDGLYRDKLVPLTFGPLHAYDV